MEIRLLVAAGFFSLLTACTTAPKTQYYWGSYEELLYLMYANPGEATPEMQIAKLTEDRHKAEAEGKPVPPGVNAHMGMMYAALGNAELAQIGRAHV